MLGPHRDEQRHPPLLQAGEDAEFFDYAQTDHDPGLDDREIVERDAEESYFDAD